MTSSKEGTLTEIQTEKPILRGAKVLDRFNETANVIKLAKPTPPDISTHFKLLTRIPTRFPSIHHI